MPSLLHRQETYLVCAILSVFILPRCLGDLQGLGALERGDRLLFPPPLVLMHSARSGFDGFMYALIDFSVATEHRVWSLLLRMELC